MEETSLEVIIAGVLDIDPNELTDSSGINETENWDSLHQFLIITAIEQSLNVKLPFEAIERATTVGQLKKILSVTDNN